VRLAEEMGAQAMLGKAHFGLARLDALDGDSAQAKEHLRISMRLLEECGSTTHLGQETQLLRSFD